MDAKQKIKPYIFGVDIGGTSIKLGLFRKDNLLEKWSISTNTEEEGKRIVPQLCVSILEKMKSRGIDVDDIAGIGIGIPGDISDDGLVLNAVNLHWHKFSLPEEVTRYIPVSVYGAKDSNLAALAELWHGTGRKFNSFIMVTLGTGVGGGVIENKKLVTGKNGSAGEIGHMMVEPAETEKCSCGHRGCLEQYASATGLRRLTLKELKAPHLPSLLDKLPESSLNTRDIVSAARRGDELAQKALRKSTDYLGRGLAAAASVMNPEAFILGGGLANAGEYYINMVREAYAEYAFLGSQNIDIIPAQLGNDAGILGAACLVLDRRGCM